MTRPSRVDGSLALSEADRSQDAVRARLYAVPDPASVRDPASWALVFMRALMEVLNGDRASTQLAGWTSRRVHQAVTRHAKTLDQQRSHRRHASQRRQVASVTITQPREGYVEVSARIRYGDRFRAVAARFDLQGGAWVCTALTLG